MSNHKFKVGDKVRYVGRHLGDPYMLGNTGVVFMVLDPDNPYPYYVHFDSPNGSRSPCKAEELALND